MAVDHPVHWNGFYPSGGPPEYSYTTGFKNNKYTHQSTWNSAEANIKAEKNLLSKTISSGGRAGAAIVELNRMIGIARSAEQQFLTSHGFKNPGNNWNRLITDINKILSTEEVFRRNVTILKQFNDNMNDKGKVNTKRYEDITTYFKDKLEDAIYDCLTIDVNASLQDILINATKGAVEKMQDVADTLIKDEEGNYLGRGTYNPGIKNEHLALRAFGELFQVIQVVQGSEFLTDISKLFDLENYIEKARQSILEGKVNKSGKNKRAKIKYKGSQSGGKGSISEIVYAEIARGLPGANNNSIQWSTVERTGPADYKVDRYQATTTVSYNQAIDTVKNNGINYHGSMRAPGIASMEELYKNLTDAQGDIVLISDKNYLIDKGFIEGRVYGKGENKVQKLGGFSAQNESSINALAGLFGALHISIFDIDALTNYLANIGENMIETQVDNQILKAISAQIGNFLFDDLSFDAGMIPSGVNIIHVFQLSGIYVPLSIILEGVRKGLDSLSKVKAESFVEVRFRASNDKPDSWSWRMTSDEQEKVWEDFRNTKLLNNKLEISFLRDFAAVIADSVRL